MGDSLTADGSASPSQAQQGADVACVEEASVSQSATEVSHSPETLLTTSGQQNAAQYARASLMDILQSSINGPAFVHNKQGPNQIPGSQILGCQIPGRAGTGPVLSSGAAMQSGELASEAVVSPDSLAGGIAGSPLEVMSPADALRQDQEATPGQRNGHLSEEEKLQQDKRSAELQYQAVYYRLRKQLLNKVDEFQAALLSKATEMLPAEYWSVPPQVIVMAVSPYGKVFSHTSEGVKGDSKTMDLLQELSSSIQKCQLDAIHASRAQVGGGKVPLPKSQQFGRLRKKSDFSRMQALFGHHFRSNLLPRALAALEIRVNEAYKKGFTGTRGEAAQTVEEEGFSLHKSGDCKNGCPQCQAFRDTVGWPNGIPLLKNPAAYQKRVLHQLCDHYELQLQEEAEAPDHPVAEATVAMQPETSADVNRQLVPGLTQGVPLLNPMKGVEAGGKLYNLAAQAARPKAHPLASGKQKSRKRDLAQRAGQVEHSKQNALDALLQVTAAARNQTDTLVPRSDPPRDRNSSEENRKASGSPRCENLASIAAALGNGVIGFDETLGTEPTNQAGSSTFQSPVEKRKRSGTTPGNQKEVLVGGLEAADGNLTPSNKRAKQ